MIHPKLFGTRTIIFDMDGTLNNSSRMAIYAVRKGLEKFYNDEGLEAPQYSDEHLIAGLGVPTNEFFRSLLTQDVAEKWEKFRDIVHSFEGEYLQTHRISYPGTKSVLKELRRRGYKLAVVSNCNTDYLNGCIDSQGLRKYFDLVTCIGVREGATKAGLVGEVLEQLGGPGVMFGDRYYDVDAATENGIPAVGALYGFGGREELKDTVTWVDDIRDLTYLFDPIKEQASILANDIFEVLSIERATIVGVSTQHSALSQTLVSSMIAALTKMNVPATRLKMDEHRLFQALNDNLSGEAFIDNFYPWQKMSEEILELDEEGRLNTIWTSTYGKRKDQNIPYRSRRGCVFIIEAPFLLQQRCIHKFDKTYWIDSNNTQVANAIKRNWEKDSINEELKLWKNKFKDANKFYIKEYNPQDICTKVVDGEIALNGGGEEFMGPG